MKEREIKFRAFGSQGQGMFEVTEINFDDASVNDGLTNCKLMQYTGLKDKNGVKIWEGDVVQERGEYVSPIDGHSSPFSRVFEVKYKGDGYRLFTNQVNGELEVIGNIHENPELLSSKEEA